MGEICSRSAVDGAVDYRGSCSNPCSVCLGCKIQFVQGRNTFNRITWAHPEFGQILAACSSDYNVVIYEEIGTMLGRAVAAM